MIAATLFNNHHICVQLLFKGDYYSECAFNSQCMYIFSKILDWESLVTIILSHYTNQALFSHKLETISGVQYIHVAIITRKATATRNSCIDYLSEFSVQPGLTNEFVQILFHIFKHHIDIQLVLISTF